MIANKLTRQIRKGIKDGCKTHGFNERHNKKRPAQFWFQNSHEGLVLFIVFYTQACRWSRCLGCNLPSKCSQYHVDFKALIAQIDHIFEDNSVKSKRNKIKKLIVSNNGSILDQDTFSSTALMYLMAKVNLNLKKLAVLSIETRIEYVELEELEFLSRALVEGEIPTELELAIGFEAFDDHIRNNAFKKGLDLKDFEKFVKKIAPFKFKLKCYFMQKPVPEMSHEEAMDDIRKAIDYLSSLTNRYGVEINMHLNPTFVAAGTVLEVCFRKGKYEPPLLSDVAKTASHGHGKNISIFIGLFDEGLAVDGGSFIRRGDKPLIKNLEKFNRTQDYRILKALDK